ncbi:MAG: SRPBCC family protein [Solirubrobacterales bacterium]
MEVTRSVEVARQQSAVWDVLRDPALMPEWLPELENFTAVSGDGTSAGDRYTIEYKRDSGNVELAVEVLEVDAPDGHSHRFEGLPVAFTIISRLEGDGDDTTWHATISVKLSFVQKALGPVIKGTLDSLADHMADGFKNYVEAE